MTLPKETGWYWILLQGYDFPVAALLCKYTEYSSHTGYIEKGFFLVGGLGDESRDGIYLKDIERIGPKIEEPKF